MKVVSDHGWPKMSDGNDANAFDAFKNERNYIAQSGKHKTTVAAMDWAIREIKRLHNAPALPNAEAVDAMVGALLFYASGSGDAGDRASAAIATFNQGNG